jgi:hypothetical protein
VVSIFKFKELYCCGSGSSKHGTKSSALHNDQEKHGQLSVAGQWHSPEIYWEISTETSCIKKILLQIKFISFSISFYGYLTIILTLLTCFNEIKFCYNKCNSVTHMISFILTFHCIWEVLGLNLGWDTDYSDRFLMVFLSPSNQIPTLGHGYFLPNLFQFIILQSS